MPTISELLRAFDFFVYAQVRARVWVTRETIIFHVERCREMWGDMGRYGEIWGDHDLPRREDVAPLELDGRAAHRLRGLARGHGARAHEERQEERRGHEAHLRAGRGGRAAAAG